MTGIRSGDVLDALPRAVIVTDPAGHILMWNNQAEQLYGWSQAEVRGRLITDVLVPVPERRHADEILRVVRAGDVWEGDFTVLRRDGEPIRVWVTDRPVVDESGAAVAIVGASEDVSEQRLLEQRAADLTRHLRLALDAGGLGTFRWDMATDLTEWDERLERLFGLEPATTDARFEARVALIHPEDQPRLLDTINDAIAAKTGFEITYRVVWPDGSVHWLDSSGQITLDDDGNATGTIGCIRDATDRVTAEEERKRLMDDALAAARAERVHRERLEFMAGINDALTAAQDHHELMTNVARAAVPRLGDWCSIYVLPDGQARIPEVETAHVDPAMVDYARRLQERFPYDPDAPTGMPHVIRTGEPIFFQAIDEDVITALDATEEERDIVRDLELWSSIAVPLVKRGRILGGLQLVMTKSRRSYTDDDLLLIEAVAARIASGLDDLRLSEEQRTIASTLQAGLLPAELPGIPGVDVAVRYWASGEGVEVGGDFYDLFGIGVGRWGVAIGDVCGKGPRAAAITGLARHTIASAAWHDDDPVAVLDHLNRAILERNPGAFCTVVYGTLTVAADTYRLKIACGGHPCPIVVRADGTADLVGLYGTLIGAFDQVDVTAVEIELHPGDSVVLYTDGVTDVPGGHGITDDWFVDLVARGGRETASAEELADHLQASLAPILSMDRRDDIALLVLRF